MRSFAMRNLKIFFRDKSAVFFSLLSVFIIIGLYALFLGDVWSISYSDIANIRFLMDSWIMAGLLAVTTVTAAMGAFGIMIEDESKKIIKDLRSSPLRRSSMAMGYLLSAFVISMIMSTVAFILAEGYILLSGGALLAPAAVVKALLLIVVSSLSSTAMLFFIASFFRSVNAFSTASTIIGTVIGFLTGIYLPIGSLPPAVQTVVKLFPPSHAASLFRQVIMDAPLKEAFLGAPAQAAAQFKEMMGVTLTMGEKSVAPWMSVTVLLAAAALFFMLSWWRMSIKKR